MAETQLIQLTDVQTYRRVDPKISDERFNAFVTDIQRDNLRNLLGDALYYAFMLSDRSSGIYKDLMDGKVYTYNSQSIRYYGLKPLLCYWWLAIAARESDLWQTNYGAIQLVNNQQQMFETSREKERIALQYMETAQGYANDVIKFLNTNASSYPLWESTDEGNGVNFLTFKV